MATGPRPTTIPSETRKQGEIWDLQALIKSLSQGVNPCDVVVGEGRGKLGKRFRDSSILKTGEYTAEIRGS